MNNDVAPFSNISISSQNLCWTIRCHTNPNKLNKKDINKITLSLYVLAHKILSVHAKSNDFGFMFIEIYVDDSGVKGEIIAVSEKGLGEFVVLEFNWINVDEALVHNRGT